MLARLTQPTLGCWLFLLHIAAGVAACPLTAWAEPAVLDIRAEIASDSELDAIRGGFTSGDGLDFSFGIEQAVLIDGVLQIATSFNAAFIAGTLARQAGTSAALHNTSADQLRSQVTTVIQNSVDQRVIDSITMINASVNSLSLSRQLNSMHAIRQQLNTATATGR